MQTGFHCSRHPEQSDAMKENTIKENQGDQLETMMTESMVQLDKRSVYLPEPRSVTASSGGKVHCQ